MRVCPRCSTETLEVTCPDDGAPTIEVQDQGPATYPAGTVFADRYRIDGVLHEEMAPPIKLKSAIISRVESGMIMGTPTYMSPEQAKGDAINGRSDIYSLGVMMYEALTGKPPFQGDTPMTVLVAHIKDIPPPMPRDGSVHNVPPEIEKVVMNCLEKDPALRPQSTIQLVDRLVNAVKAVRDPHPTTISRAPLEAGKTEGFSAVDTSMVQAQQVRPPTPIVSDAPAHPASNRTPLYIGLGAFTAVALLAVAVALLAGGKQNAAGVPVQAAPQTVPQALPLSPAVLGTVLTQPASAPTAEAHVQPQVPAAKVQPVAKPEPMHETVRAPEVVKVSEKAVKAPEKASDKVTEKPPGKVTEKPVAAVEVHNPPIKKTSGESEKKGQDKTPEKVEHRERKHDPKDFQLDDEPPKK